MSSSLGKAATGRDWFGLCDFCVPVDSADTLYLLDSVGSTNDFLMGKGEAAIGRKCVLDDGDWLAGELGSCVPLLNAQPGTLVVGRRQTAGHGRQGRTWLDCGGLNFSFVVDSERAAVARGFSVWLGLMVTLVLRETFAIDARLKWPNDILVKGKKVGGILLQRRGTPVAPLLVAGIGLNLNAAVADLPSSLEATATSFWLETGRKFQPAQVAAPVLTKVVTEVDGFHENGWRDFRGRWQQWNALADATVKLVAGEETHAGQVIGLSDSGALILKLEGSGEEMAFHAGEVHLVPSDARGRQG